MTEFVAIGQHYWGRGQTAEEAKKAFRKQDGVLSLGYSIYEFQPPLEFWNVTGLGYITWKGEGKPIVSEFPPKGTKR